MAYKDPAKQRAYQAEYRATHKEEKRAKQSAYYATHKEAMRAQQATYYSTHRGEKSAYGAAKRAALRQDAFKAYGGAICVCCKESSDEFLTIDHIAGGGAEHRRQIGANLYRWLKKEGYPPGFRVLCFNCNCSLGHYGYCPHGSIKIEKEQTVTNHKAKLQGTLWGD